MSQAREIKAKVRSIRSTQQITRAMEMVAASKMRRTQEQMQASRPYLNCVKAVIHHMEKGNLQEMHPYLVARPIKKVAFIVISSDRGLCGGLNSNLFRVLIKQMAGFADRGIDNIVCTIGGKAERFFARNHANVFASVTDIGDRPDMQDLLGVINAALTAFDNQEVDQILLAYNKYVSSLKQEPTIEVLLPAVDEAYMQRQGGWDYIYEPSPTVLLEALLHRYIETLIYQAVVENAACEQAARMLAMRNASDNAQEIIDELKLMYNKARQAAITKELAEIVAGAAAV